MVTRRKTRPRWLAGPDDGKLDYYHETEGRNGDFIVLEEDIVFRDSRGVIWIAPSGLRYDGASNPRIFWSISGHPLEKRHILAGAIHDETYQNGARLTIDFDKLSARDAILLARAELPAAEVCALPRKQIIIERDEADYFGLYEPLTATWGNSALHCHVYYRAVRLGGWRPWGQHERRRAAERIPFSSITVTPG